MRGGLRTRGPNRAPVGGRLDGQSTNEGQTNFDWNPVWDVAVGRFEGGWTVETSMPFKSLRYRPGPVQVWGFNMRRTNVWKNEFSYLSPITAGVGRLGLRPALMAPVVGVEGQFVANLAGSRVIYSLSPRMFTSALLQYDTLGHGTSVNVRLRWEYQPGSELFVVYNEQRDTFRRRFPQLQNRALIVKFNRLFRF